MKIITLFLFFTFSGAYAQADCPPGQHLDPVMQMCMPDVPSVSVCPTGQFWDTSMIPAMCMPLPAPNTFRGISMNVFNVSCVSCHQSHGSADPAEGGIDFSSYQAMIGSNLNTSNTHHAPFIIAGKPEESKLYLTLISGKMPMTENGDAGIPLSADSIQNIYDWIKLGALNN